MNSLEGIQLCNDIGMPWFGDAVWAWWNEQAMISGMSIANWLRRRHEEATTGVITDSERKTIKTLKPIGDIDTVMGNDELSTRWKGVPGILFLWGSDESGDRRCLTGGQTVDLYGHILSFLRLSDKRLVKEWPDDNRWWEIANRWHAFRIYVMEDATRTSTQYQREIIEALYAVKHDAIYWKPTWGKQQSVTNALQSLPKDELPEVESIGESQELEVISRIVKRIQRDPYCVERHVAICMKYEHIKGYVNEYTWGNHLRNAILAGYPDTEEGVDAYLRDRNDQIGRDMAEKAEYLRTKRDSESELLQSLGVTLHDHTSFYHWVIAAHRHDFNTGDPMLDVQLYLQWCEESEAEQKRLDDMQKASNERLAQSLGFTNYQSAVSNARKNGFDQEDPRDAIKLYAESLREIEERIQKEREELETRHRDFMTSLGMSYVSEYSWGRTLSLAKSHGFDFKVIGEEEAIRKYVMLKQEKRNEELTLAEQQAAFMAEHGHPGCNWHNTLVNARKCGFRSGDDKQDILDHWRRLDLLKKKRLEEQERIKKEHMELLEKFGMPYRGEQVFSRYVNTAKRLGYDGVEQYLSKISKDL